MKILRICGMFGGFLSLILSLSAQTLTTLHSFDGTDGANPNAALIQATNGYLYGTTSGGGANGNGTVFQITPSGKLTTLYSFCSQSGCTDGATPLAALIQAANGYLYGTTYEGGASDIGSVFKITPSGKLTTLHSFDGTDGSYPTAGLVQGTDGNFYGTTGRGGANCAPDGCGTVFKMTPNGTLATLYSFCPVVENGACTDGSNPYAGLVQGTNGAFYGTTQFGGVTPSGGTVFKITASGKLTTLYSFYMSPYGGTGDPTGGLVQATNGNFYGTVECSSGFNNSCGGMVFKMAPSGTMTFLYTFDEKTGYCPDGILPVAALIQATDGELYGTTTECGANGEGGTVFQITAGGNFTLLYSFCSQNGCTDGEDPQAALVQDTNGTFYGTTWAGGANGDGAVFSLSVGLGPFVETNPTSGNVGAAVNILGTDLTGATSVTFNGTAAKFTVVSKSEIKTTVPTGATTGPVDVTTPKGTLKSNVVFRVKK